MPRTQVLTSNFTAGEFSPRLRGRTDIDKFAASAEKLENMVVFRQGGATMRPSLDFKGEVKTSANITRLIDFVYSRVDAFVIEFGNSVVRVWRDGVLVESSPGVPLEIASPYASSQLAELDYTQGGDTLLLFHPVITTRRLRRFTTTVWSLEEVPYDPPALYEFGHASQTTTFTLSAATVGAGRTVTAATAGFSFLASDVGRVITSGPGSLTITGYTSATQVTGTITSAFTGTALGTTWRVQGTPQTTITPSAATPVGATITLTAAADAWRNSAGFAGSDDFNGTGFVEVNGGLVKLTTITSALIANGTIIRELLGVVAAPKDSWVLKNSVWNTYDGYPRTGTLFQQRLWLGGTTAFPLSFWGSRPGLFFEFLPGTDDDSAVYKTIDSDENDIIQYLSNGGDRVIGNTYASEFDVVGGVEKPITQSNAQITRRSGWGAAGVRPVHAGADVMFVERGAAAIRALQRDQIGTYQAIDISVFSDHLLTSGVVAMSFEQRPESVLWIVTGAGQLLAMTYNREQAQVTLCSALHSGVVEWVVTVPESTIDASYALVRRTIGGATKRYVERLNWSVYPGMDSRKEVTGAASASWAGFSHLNGETVVVLADDIHMGQQVVTGGLVTLPRTALKVAAGLPYTARVALSAPDPGTGSGTAQGQAMSMNRVWARFLNTIGATCNAQDLGFQQFDGPLLDVAPAPFTGVKSTSETGWAEGDAPLELAQALPYPFTVLTVVRSITINAG